MQKAEKGPENTRTQLAANQPERRARGARGARNPARRATDFSTDSTAVRAKNRPGEAAILEITGKSWREWFVLLNAAGVEREERKKVIAGNTGANFWWRNVVLLSYELDRGMRQQYAKPVGYEISVSRTVTARVANLFPYWSREDLRHTWLGTKTIKIDTVTLNKTALNKALHASLKDGTSWLEVKFHSKDQGKTQIVVKHQNLAQDQIAAMKSFWTRALKNLKAIVDAGQP